MKDIKENREEKDMIYIENRKQDGRYKFKRNIHIRFRRTIQFNKDTKIVRLD